VPGRPGQPVDPHQVALTPDRHGSAGIAAGNRPGNFPRRQPF